MSYILEALRKADQERSAGSVPSLEAVHESSQDGGRFRWWFWGLAVLILVNGMVLAVLVMRDDSDAPAAVSSTPGPESKARTTVQAPPPAVIQSPPPAVTQSPPPKVTRVSPQTVHQPPQAAVTQAPPSKVTQPVPAPDTVPAPAATASVPAVRKTSASGSAVAETAAAEKSARPVTGQTPVVARAEAGTVPAVADRETASRPASSPAAKVSDLPYWDQMSIEFRSGFNVPRLDVHVYDEDPKRRFLLVDLKKYREGDRLEGGIVIEEILPDGVQLSHKGTRFIYRK